MSRHEGVSCDSCLKGNFRGRRYKCLICYDYDLCSTCYESGATTTRHTTEHPMQCILTRSDFDLYYGGEALSVDQPQSFTCPLCGKMGFTETTLHDHVSLEHSGSSFEVVCPVCAAVPVGEPNHVTDDFLGHLTLEHRGTRDIDESGGGSSNSRPVRRIPHPGRGGMNHGPRRRHAAHMQFASSSTGFTSLSPSNRESMDPIAELLSQLSGVRRSAASAVANPQSTSAQLQQLQMQLQLERQQAQMARQQLERLPSARRQFLATTDPATTVTSTMRPILAPTSSSAIGNTFLQVAQQQLDPRPPQANVHSTQFLLSRCTETNLSESELNALEVDRADHSMFVQELLLMSLCDESSTTGSSANTTDSAIGDLLPTDDKSSHEQSDAPIEGNSNSVKMLEGASASTKTIASSNTEHLSNSSLVHSRKPTASNSKPVKPQPVVVVRDTPVQSSINRMVLPTRISGSGTQNIGAGYNMRSQPSGAAQGIVRGGSPAGGTSSGRTRKAQRHIDDRNKSNEPPPPH